MFPIIFPKFQPFNAEKITPDFQRWTSKVEQVNVTFICPSFSFPPLRLFGALFTSRLRERKCEW